MYSNAPSVTVISVVTHKLAVGLCESALKREVFQFCDQFMDMDSLRTYCVAYEVTHRDAIAEPRHEAVVAADITATNDVIIAAQVAGRCGNCNRQHPTGRVTCPARNVICFACGKLGHFCKSCKSTERSSKTDAAVHVLIADAHMTSQPHLDISVAAPDIEK